MANRDNPDDLTDASFPDYTPAPDVPSDAAGVTPAGTHIEEID